MARIANNKDGTLTLTLDELELDTFEALPADQLQNYVTLWLSERAREVIVRRFDKLSPADKTEIAKKLKDAESPIIRPGGPPDTPGGGPP